MVERRRRIERSAWWWVVVIRGIVAIAATIQWIARSPEGESETLPPPPVEEPELPPGAAPDEGG